MAKFKVGDKAEFIERYCGYKIGDVVEIIDVVLGGAVVNAKGKLGIFPIYTDSLKLVEPKLTKNQRIKALEKEIAELRYFKELAQEMEDNSFHDLERIEEIEGRLEHLEQAVQQYFAVPGEPSTVEDKPKTALLHAIEQVVQSILIRDKYIRVLFTIQFLLILLLSLIQVFNR